MTLNEFLMKAKRRMTAYSHQAIRGCIPIDPNMVLFVTFQGKFTCNPKYICRRLHEMAPDVRCVWVIPGSGERAGFPDYAETVVFGTPQYFRALYSAKVLVDNGFNFVRQPFAKKKGQYYIETMHGSLGIKRIDSSSNTNAKRNRIGYRCGELCDYIISNSSFETDVYRSSFWEKTPVLLYGHARNDVLVRGADISPAGGNDLRDKVRVFYGLPADARLALFAPTFARQASKGFEAFDAGLLRDCLKERFGGKWYILKRLHPKDCRSRSVKPDRDYVLNGNLYTDIQELMVAIDFAVTDYSSWIFDYVITKKPGIIYAPDLEEYQNSTGFYYPITAAPFPLAKDNAAVKRIIGGFDMKKYAHDVDLFLEDKGCVDDGRASERAAVMIRNLLEDRLPDDERGGHFE